MGVKITKDALAVINRASVSSDLHVGGNLTVAGTQAITGAVTFAGNQTIGDAAGDAHTINGTVAGYRALVESVTADDTLTVAESGKTFVFADAAAVLTLPDSGAGDIIGCTFKFYSNLQATGQEVKCTDTTNEKIIGNLVSVHIDDDSAAAVPWNAQASDSFSSVEFTSVADGAIGSWFQLTNIAADLWSIDGVINQSGGSEVTPFATS